MGKPTRQRSIVVAGEPLRFVSAPRRSQAADPDQVPPGYWDRLDETVRSWPRLPPEADGPEPASLI